MHGSRGRRRRLAKGRRNAPILLHVHFTPEAVGHSTYGGVLAHAVVVDDLTDVWARSSVAADVQRTRNVLAARTPPAPKLSGRERYLKRAGRKA